MYARNANRNIVLYKVFTMFSEPLFWGPIVILSIQRLGLMDLPSIYFMESAVLVLCIALNVPAGALADIIGRKKTLIIGRLCLFASTCFFATMSSPFDAWLANILWAIGLSFQSGADQALLYNSLKVSGEEGQFTKIEGAAVGFRFILTSLCSLLVGVFAAINMRYTLYLNIPFSLIPLIIAFLLHEEPVKTGFSVSRQYVVIKRGIQFAITKSEILWIILFCALIGGASKIWFFTYNPYFELVGVQLKYFGVIFFMLNVVAWLSSRYAHRIEQVLSERMCVAIMVSCVGIPMIIMGLFPIWPMALLIVIQNVVRGFMGPFVGNFMNRHIDDEEIRATTLSVRSTLSDIVSVVSLSWFGIMDKRLGLLVSLVILGVVVLVLGKFSHARHKRLFPESEC